MTRATVLEAVAGLVACLVAGMGLVSAAQPGPTGPSGPGSPASQPADVGDPIMGDYEGTCQVEGKDVPVAAKLVADGKGEYHLVLDCPGSKDAKGNPMVLKGKLEEGKAHFAAANSPWTADLADGKLAAQSAGDAPKGPFQFKHVVKRSPTEGAKPPAGAIVLLPFEAGKPTHLDEWTNKKWQVLPDGSALVTGDSKTVRPFQDVQLHVEFLCPFMPAARGQGRGNSGVYLHDRYEVQVLDSFGEPARHNEAGGIYTVAVPKVNASFPPLSWQTYDITFRAPRFSADLKQQTSPAEITVVYNGVTVHDKVKLEKYTGGAAPGNVEKAPVRLQGHGCPVRFRNVWAVELKDQPEAKPETR